MNKEKKKMNPVIKDIVLTNLIQLGTIILFGVLTGYLLWRNAEKEKDPQGNIYFIFSIILFAVIGITIFTVKTVKKIKAYKKGKENKSNE